jgi:GntR family transcriptional regulator
MTTVKRRARTTVLNREAPRPLYLQIETVLDQKILSGEWKPGDRVSSENEIAAMYGVSRVTARQAIEQLVAKNMLYRRPGKGTFVSEQGLSYGFSTMLSFSASLKAKGFDVETRVLDHGVVPAPDYIAEKLCLDDDAELVVVRRLRIVDRIPAAIHASYLSARVYASLLQADVATQSLLSAVERIGGVRMAYSQDSMRAVSASVADADLLGVPPGTAMMELEGVVYDEQNRPCRYTKGIYRGNLFRFDVRNTRNNATVLTISAVSENAAEERQGAFPSGGRAAAVARARR